MPPCGRAGQTPVAAENGEATIFLWAGTQRIWNLGGLFLSAQSPAYLQDGDVDDDSLRLLRAS